MSRSWWVAGIVPAWLSITAPALGDSTAADAAAAASLFKEGRALMDRADYVHACAKLEAANRLLTTPGTLLTIADCQEKAGRPATAYGAFKQAGILARQQGDLERDAEAKRRAEQLEPTLPRLALDVDPASRGVDVALKRDGRDVPAAAWDSPIPIDPGAHTLEATKPGKRPWATSFTIDAKPGLTTVHVPALVDVATGAAAPFWGAQRIAGVAVGGAGVVGLVVGAVFGARALTLNGESKQSCSPTDPNFCNDTGVSLRSDAQTAATISTVAIVVGGAALVGGVVLFATSSRGRATTGVRLEIAPQGRGIALSGRL